MERDTMPIQSYIMYTYNELYKQIRQIDRQEDIQISGMCNRQIDRQIGRYIDKWNV